VLRVLRVLHVFVVIRVSRVLRVLHASRVFRASRVGLADLVVPMACLVLLHSRLTPPNLLPYPPGV
jgi:hypothetical protein